MGRGTDTPRPTHPAGWPDARPKVIILARVDVALTRRAWRAGTPNRPTLSVSENPVRIVVLTRGGRYGVLILRALQRRGLIPGAVVVEAHAALHLCFRKATPAERTFELPLALARSVNRSLRPRLRRDLRIGAPLVVTGALNSPTMLRDLRRLAPDVLVIAGTGIVSAEVLAIPRLGAVNSHLALLPWIRGNDVIAHSILNGVALGTTCHLVDPGIDTGPILRRRLLDVPAFEQTLDALESASLDAGVDLLVDVVAEVVARGGLPPATPQSERFPLHRFLGAARRAEADAMIRAGAARVVYARWTAAGVGTGRDLAATFQRPADR